MPLHWLDALLNLSPSTFPLDDYRPEVAHPDSAQDRIANINWLKNWLTSVFTNVLKLDPDIAKRTTALPYPVEDVGERLQIFWVRIRLEEVRRTAFATLDDLAAVLQEQEFGSHALLSPHIEMVWPIIRAHLDHPEGLQFHHACFMLERMKGLQIEARHDMTQILSINERGRQMLQTFDWKPYVSPACSHSYTSLRMHILGK